MNLKFRRKLYIFFIFLFFLIAPLLILYAAGYRLGAGFNIQKTGALILNSHPKSAKIIINGKMHKSFWKNIISIRKSYTQTPTKINYLRPGEYLVRMELPGYWPWEKKLIVKPGQATFAEDVYLFKKNIPSLLYDGKITNINYSQSAKYLIVDTQKSAIKINPKNFSPEIFTYPQTKTNNTPAPVFSPHGNMAVVNDFLFYKENWQHPFQLTQIGVRGDIWRWHNTDNNKLFFINKNNLFYFNINKKSVSALPVETKIDDFLPQDEFIYLLTKKESSSELLVKKIKNMQTERKINLPLSNYTFSFPFKNTITVYDKNFNIFYLINPFSTIKPLRDTIPNANKIFWINKDKLVLANDFEVWLYKLKTTINSREKILLTRVSDQINGIFWHPSNNYVIYSTNKNINVIELDDRDRFNITKLFAATEISNVFFDPEEKIIYFIAKINKQKKLYKMAI